MSEMEIVRRRLVVGAGIGLAGTMVSGWTRGGLGWAQKASAEIPKQDLMQPEELTKVLQAGGEEKPLMLQVGSRVLFNEAHIAGSEYVGAGGQESGLKALRARLKDVPHDKAVVLYCGCCPWGNCPNMRPAYAAMKGMGFTQVKALYIGEDFGTDWVEKKYPVERGRAK